MSDVETVRSTLATVRKERDRAFVLLRALNIAGYVPVELKPSVYGLVAMESEGDIEDAAREALDLLSEYGVREARHV